MVHSFDDYINFGFVKRIHGLSGSLLISLRYDIKRFTDIIFNVNHNMIPFLVEESSTYSDYLMIKLFGIDSLDEATFLKGTKALINKKYLSKEDVLSSELVGFTFYDVQSGFTGIVTDVNSLPMQKMIFISSKESSNIMVPLHEDFNPKINREKKCITLSLPKNFFD